MSYERVPEVFVRICTRCQEKTSRRYLAIYGCTIDGNPLYCSECSSFNHCSLRLVTPDDDQITAGYCQKCQKALSKKSR